MAFDQEALQLHQQHQGKVEVSSLVTVRTKDDLSTVYTPGVAAVCRAIAADPSLAATHTLKGRTIAIVSDGTAVLGLGDIGPEAAMPVMEGKALLFKEMGGVDAFPLCIAEKGVDEIVALVKALAPTFGGVNLEDISAPRCFEIERRLKEELDIPVFHDDQWGTAIVTLAGLINATTLTERSLSQSKIVISGAGAAGIAIAKLLIHTGATNVILCDSRGAISQDRDGLNSEKILMLETTNPHNESGSLQNVLNGADIFIGVSAPNLLTAEHISTMKTNPIVFAMANPDPEILPDEAKQGGAAVVATGRSDFANQVNNALVFPGLFKGALAHHVKAFTLEHMSKAATLLAGMVEHPTTEHILPDVLDAGVADTIAQAFES